MIDRPRFPRTLAVLILALLLTSAVAALAQEAEELPPEAAAAMGIGMMVVIGLAVLVGLIIQIVIIVFLYKDAQARNQQGALWAILGFLFGWIALVVWLIIRPKQ